MKTKSLLNDLETARFCNERANTQWTMFQKWIKKLPNTLIRKTESLIIMNTWFSTCPTGYTSQFLFTANQCCRFSWNITWITPKFFFFNCVKKYGQGQSIKQKWFNFEKKLLPTLHADHWILSIIKMMFLGIFKS